MDREVRTKAGRSVMDNERSTTWRRGRNAKQLDKLLGKDRPMLPICPYGCGEEGQFKEIVMGEDGKAVGIFADSDGCVFTANIEVGEPIKPTRKRKLVRGIDGQLTEVEDSA